MSSIIAQDAAVERAQARIKAEIDGRRGAQVDRARERWDRFTEEALGKARRLDDARAIGREILRREDTARAADVVRQSARDVALVKIAPPGAREPAHGVGEAGELSVGRFRIVRQGALNIGVVRLADGSLRAVRNFCPHKGAPNIPCSEKTASWSASGGTKRYT